jgi:hypothetical protein
LKFPTLEQGGGPVAGVHQSGRRIILLTVFVKTQRQEGREIQRAKLAMERCAAEQHNADYEE